jgi:hypothetical protein
MAESSLSGTMPAGASFAALGRGAMCSIKLVWKGGLPNRHGSTWMTFTAFAGRTAT